MLYRGPYSVQGDFGVIRSTSFKVTCSSKTAGRRVKLTTIWGPEILGQHILRGTFVPWMSASRTHLLGPCLTMVGLAIKHQNYDYSP